MTASLLDQTSLYMMKQNIPREDFIGLPVDVLLHGMLAEATIADRSVFNFPIHHAVKESRKTLSSHSIHPPTETYQILLKKYQLPEPFNEIHRRVPTDDDEVSWNNWIFFSAKKMLEMVNANHQKHFIDVASSYLGMGWVRVLSWDKTANAFFFRTDGGENGYTREDHFKYFNKNADTAKGFNIYDDLSKCMNFHDFLTMDPSNYESRTYRLKYDENLSNHI